MKMLRLQNLIKAIAHKELDPINKARVLMLVYFLIAHFLLGLLLMAAYAYTQQIPQLVRASLISLFSASLFFVLYRFNSWRVISHLVLMLITIMGVWANLLFFVQGINAATLQYIWMTSALGFYMHGSRWGWLYAVVNMVPVLLDAAFTGNNYFVLGSAPQTISRPIYLFILIFDFTVIAFLHHYFFKAFKHNIAALTNTKNQLNVINEQLNETVEEIKHLSNVRMNFLSTMSHELRTPLNGVIGLTNVLLLQNPRKDQEETLSVLRFSAENLLALVNDVLDFNKLELAMVTLERTPFNVSNLLANIYASTKLKASEKHLDFQVDVASRLKELTLIGDPTRLTQVLLNLLNNAIKFTEKGSVKLVCSIAEITNNELRIKFVVEDTGIGIEESRQQEVFEEFVQASSSTNRNYGGTGLGLAIVRRVLALHQSHIQVESAIGKGAKFVFNISYAYEKAAALTSDNLKGEEDRANLSAMKILVAEDNMVNAMVIKKTLNSFGIDPDIAENGSVALAMHLEKNYDLILMDLYMPELDGYQATVKIRSLDHALKAAIPIVALTATVNSQVADEVLAVGMNGYLSKPFHPNDLFEELCKYVV